MWKALRAQGIFRGTGAGRARSPSSTPGRARSTSTCSTGLRETRADRRRDVRRGRPRDDAAARQAAHASTSSSTQPTTRRRRRGRGGPAADRDHPARGAGHRRRAHPPARRLRHRARHGDGAQPRRVRRAGRRGRPAVRRRARGGQRARPRDDPRRRSTTTARWRRSSRRSTRSSRCSTAIDGYVVVANVNSTQPGGDRRRHARRSRQAMDAFQRRRLHGRRRCRSATPSTPDRGAGQRAAAPACSRGFDLQPPTRADRRQRRPASFYPMGPDVVPQMLDLLGAAGRLAGAVRQGPRDALRGRRARLRRGRPEEGAPRLRRGRARASATTSSSLFTNHPKLGDVVAFNQALCGLYAAGLGVGDRRRPPRRAGDRRRRHRRLPPRRCRVLAPPAPTPCRAHAAAADAGRRRPLRAARPPVRRFPRPRRRDLRRRQRRAARCEPVVHHRRRARPARHRARLRRRQRRPHPARRAVHRRHPDAAAPRDGRQAHHAAGQERGRRSARFEAIDEPARRHQAGGARRRASTSAREFGVPADRARRARPRHAARHRRRASTRCATPGIPLVMRYKTTTKGTQLPDRWGLPDALRDDTGVIFASAFPGYDSFAQRSDGATTRTGARARASSRRCERCGARDARRRRRCRPAEIDRRHRASCAPRSSSSRTRFDRRFLFRVLVDGPLAVRRAHRRARPEHRRSTRPARAPRRPSPSAEDWIRAGPLPPRDRHRRRRRHLATTCWSGSAPASWPRGAAATDERGRGGGAPVRPPPPRHDHRHGRRGARRRERRGGARARPRSRSARCWARSPPTAPSTARASTSTTSAR